VSKSILQDEKSCFITGRTTGLHKHHIYGNAGNRPISEEQGFWVWLSHEYHTNSNECVHKNHPFNLTLKKMCQQVYEDKLMLDQGISRESARDRFMKMIGRSYI
jgi:hypothetical protein